VQTRQVGGPMKRSWIYVTGLVVVLFLAFFAVLHVWKRSNLSIAYSVGHTPATVTNESVPVGDAAPTTVHAHNLRLRKGPTFQVYVRWIRGEMVRTRADRIPSLEDEESFVFAIDKGVVRANLADLNKFLNAALAQSGPLKNMSVTGSGTEMKLSGTMHKLMVPLPVEMQATVSPMPDGRIHLHATKINVLKVPMKGLMGVVKLSVKDFVGSTPSPGVQVSGDDLYLDTTALLPPPQIRGKITSIAFDGQDVVLIFGNAPNDEAELAQWHNFLRLTDGTVTFGKLTMRNADLTLIDASDEPWFDLDLEKYQEQLVQGYTRLTPEGGLEMFMPGIGEKMPVGAVPLETLRDKSKPLPAAPVKK
jgi:hypothetical protein